MPNIVWIIVEMPLPTNVELMSSFRSFAGIFFNQTIGEQHGNPPNSPLLSPAHKLSVIRNGTVRRAETHTMTCWKFAIQKHSEFFRKLDLWIPLHQEWHLKHQHDSRWSRGVTLSTPILILSKWNVPSFWEPFFLIRMIRPWNTQLLFWTILLVFPLKQEPRGSR